MNEFMTDEEYERCFIDFWGIRSKIAHLLLDYGLQSGSTVLDVPSGHGLFGYEIAKIIKKGEIHAVGLLSDLGTFRQFFGRLKGPEKEYLKLMSYYVADATDLPFQSGKFDFVVNFLGLEDVNMTRGIAGVRKSISEFVRVLKSNGIILITVCLEGNKPDQVLAKEITEYMGINARFYSRDFYYSELQKSAVKIVCEKWIHTYRKMTAAQAKEELQFACEEAPRIFKKFNVSAVPFDDLWQKFGERIEKHGMAYYSDLCIMVGRK
ncbi:MAG: methyltransferase domain-containing protein [Theionarchaea archaeon]|nr:methyltransferase domain-containing protein [Theionarchaea archaeon]